MTEAAFNGTRTRPIALILRDFGVNSFFSSQTEQASNAGSSMSAQMSSSIFRSVVLTFTFVSLSLIGP